MKIDVLISSKQNEFEEEIKFLVDSIRNDASFNEYFNVYTFKKDISKSQSADKDFTTQIENKYANGVIDCEFVNAKNPNSYFFVKMDKKEFFNTIEDSKRYKKFTTKEELLKYVKISLREHIIRNSKRKNFDSAVINESTYDDVDEDAIRLFKKFLTDKSIKELFNERSPEKF